jgi:hypothetical protein
MNCNYCGTGISGYYYKDVWNNCNHISHYDGKSILCSCCSGLINPNVYPKPELLQDGRYICGYCNYNAIKNDSQKQDVFNYVLAIYRQGKIEFPLNRLKLNLANKHEMEKRNKLMLGYTTAKFKTFAKTQYKLEVLSGLDKTLFAGVLAHELMHVLIFEQNINLSLEKTEGLCELASFFIYKNFKSVVAENRIMSIEENPDPIYGDGFRDMKKRLYHFGSLQELIRSLK